MKWFLGMVFVAVVLISPSRLARADEKDAKAILDKAIKAVGGEAKLGPITAATWKTKGKISFGGGDNEFTTQVTFQGLDHFRQEFEGEFGGNKVQGVTVLNGDKAWRKFGDMNMALDKDAVANEKRTVYLQVIPVTLVPLQEKGFKLNTAGEEKVGGKSAVGISATEPDGKEFKLYFDKDSGLPVKLVAKVIGFMGEEFTQETLYDNYKDFGGIKKATRVESKRDGERFLLQEITEFKVLDKVDPKTFAEPQ
ncbi:MAG TPA: hypothetical protein VFA18_16095 [Gemmataceae bacterium]|nr:hypothetical protein [Gemmataceae bacterium]